MFAAMIRAALAAAPLAVTLPALAAPDVPPPSGQFGHPYQRELSSTCNLGPGCEINFPVVPANRRLDLQLANCAVQGAGNVESIALFLNEGSTPLISHELFERQAIDYGSTTRHLYSEEVLFSVVSGRHIMASVLMSSGGLGMRCSIFGTLVVLP